MGMNNQERLLMTGGPPDRLSQDMAELRLKQDGSPESAPPAARPAQPAAQPVAQPAAAPSAAPATAPPTPLAPVAASLNGTDLQARILALAASRPRRDSGAAHGPAQSLSERRGFTPPRGTVPPSLGPIPGRPGAAAARGPNGPATAPAHGARQPQGAPLGAPQRRNPGFSLGLLPETKTAPKADLFGSYKKYIDVTTGSLNFAGKAALHSKGIDFSNGTSFHIALSELELLEELGAGNYGTVSKVLHKPTNIVMAMKEIRLELDEQAFSQIIMELDVLHRANLVNIVEFYGAFFCESSVYVCMEYMDGGSINKIYKGGVPEEYLALIVERTIQSLKALKDKYKIIHRDVKPTNILCSTNGTVKLCDFGVSGNLVASIAKTNVGCQAYMAPERIRTGGNMAQLTYTVESDIWSLGLSTIEMASGTYPYPQEAYSNIFSQLTAIVDGLAPELDPAKYSPEACAFVAKCLEKNPAKRPSYAELLDHPWLKGRDFSHVDMAGFVKQRLGAETVPAPASAPASAPAPSGSLAGPAHKSPGN